MLVFSTSLSLQAYSIFISQPSFLPPLQILPPPFLSFISPYLFVHLLSSVLTSEIWKSNYFPISVAAVAAPTGCPSRMRPGEEAGGLLNGIPGPCPRLVPAAGEQLPHALSPHLNPSLSLAAPACLLGGKGSS